MASDFPCDWRVLPLERCMSAIIDYRGKTPRKTRFGIPLVTAKVVKDGRIETPDEFIAADDYDDWMRRGLPQANDVVMTTEAPLGEIAQLDGTKVALAQRLITLRGCLDLLDGTFLKFLMQSAFVQEQLKARATGTTVLGIKQSELRKVSLVLPPLPEQRAIACILGTLDDKIELNRRMNETLEAMARALFKSWFVDFDPVRAKMDGRQPEGMDKATVDLFPDSFEDSALGKIPKGWNIQPLSEVVQVNPQRSLRRGELAPYLDMKNMPTQGHRPTGWIDRPMASGMKFINGDTLVARITPCLENGKTAFVDFLREEQVGWGSTEYIVLRPKPPLPTEYAYFLARGEELRTHAIQNMTGSSGRQRVPAECLTQFTLAVPTPDVAKRFGDAVGPLLARAKANGEQNANLAALRDALLPKLLSGEIRVPAAERMVGRSR
jgi:type I restriction enzyme, S subunit